MRTLFWTVPRTFIAIAVLFVLFGPASEGHAAEAEETVEEGLAVDGATRGFHELLNPIAEKHAFQNAKVGLHVVHVNSGEEMFSWNVDKTYVPASTMKAVTAAAALRALGSSYRFTTDLSVDGEVDGAGVLKGNLYVKGHGDPTMVVERLWKLVQEVRLHGITTIEGNVIFDATFFDGTAQLEGWGKRHDIERGPAYFATLSALSLNFNTIALVIGPGTEVGGEASVIPETPSSTYIEIDNQAITGEEGVRKWVKLTREVEPGKTRFVVEGVMPADSEVTKTYRTVADPTAYFIAAWKEMSVAHGIKVTGSFKRGTTPTSARLVHQHRSAPLTTVLMDMNKFSNNFMAEQVLKTVGAEMYGAPGTTQKGLQWVTEYLKEIGVPEEDFTLINGSGLSRETHLKPTVLSAILVDMARNSRIGPEFRVSLAISGTDGTLWKRLKDEQARVRGKTGTIDGVHCLTGYLVADNDELYAFTFLVNGIRGRIGPVKKLQDALLRRIIHASGQVADAGVGTGG